MESRDFVATPSSNRILTAMVGPITALQGYKPGISSSQELDVLLAGVDPAAARTMLQLVHVADDLNRQFERWERRGSGKTYPLFVANHGDDNLVYIPAFNISMKGKNGRNLRKRLRQKIATEVASRRVRGLPVPPSISAKEAGRRGLRTLTVPLKLPELALLQEVTARRAEGKRILVSAVPEKAADRVRLVKHGRHPNAYLAIKDVRPIEPGESGTLHEEWLEGPDGPFAVLTGRGVLFVEVSQNG